VRVLYLGRFQPFHKGHAAVLDALKDVDVIVGIGSAFGDPTSDNPFTSRERIEMILRSGYRPYLMLPIADIHNYPIWVKHVESIVPDFDSVVTNNPRDRELFSNAGYPLREVPLVNRDEYNATYIRGLMADGGPWEQLVPSGTVEVVKTIDISDRFRARSDHED